MYKSLHIKNFQSHENSTFVFSPFVNIILGLSTVGKTAVLRSLRLLTENRPSGAKFFSNFAGNEGKTEIDLKLDNGQIKIEKSIHRPDKGKDKGKKILDKTDYELITKDGSSFSFHGVDKSVPDQVAALLNLTELNFQKQFDPPFLISSETSNGQIARTINKITNLEEVDEWVSSFTTDINESNGDITKLNAEIKQGESDLEKYSDLEETGKLIDQLSDIDKRLSKLASDFDSIQRQIETENSIQIKLESLRELVKCERYIIKIDKLQIQIDRYWNLKDRIDKQGYYQNQIDRLSPDLELLSSILQKLSFINEKMTRHESLEELYLRISRSESKQISLKKELNELSEIYGKIKPIDRKRYDQLLSWCDDQEHIQNNIDNAKEELKDKKKEYAVVLARVGKCPICSSELSTKQIKQIEKEL